MVAPELQKVAARQAGKLLVVKVNTDELSELGQRFRIQSIPTMAVFAGGQEVGPDVRRTSGERHRSVRRTGDFKRSSLTNGEAELPPSRMQNLQNASESQLR